MQILITGGNGFLGAWITARLLARDFTVRIFDVVENRRLVDAIAGPQGAGVTWHVGDITRQDDVMAAAKGCDGIINLAGILTPACTAEPVRGAMINYIGTLHVFEAARAYGINRVIYTSSAGVFGAPEGSQPFPVTHYGTAKLACEGSARAYLADHGIPSVGFRPFIVYGPGRETGMTAGPSLACRAAVHGDAYTIPYRGTAGMVFVDDVAAAYEHALISEPDGARVFNICGELASNEQIVDEIRRIVPDAKLAIDGPDTGIARDINDAPLFAAFPALPRTSLRDGIARTVAFYRQQRLNT